MTRNDHRSRLFAELKAENARLRAVLLAINPGGDSAEPGLTVPHNGRQEPRVERALTAALWESQAALARSEERLNLASAASGFLAWWDWDIPGDRFYTSESFARLSGAEPGAAPATAFLDGIHPEDRGWVRARIARGMAEGGDFAEDYRLCLPDGTVRWVHARGRFSRDAVGRPERFAGVALDITERKATDLRKDALLALGEALRDSDDVEAMARAAARIMAGALGAVRAGYGTVDPDRETVHMMPGWHAPGAIEIAGLYAFRDYGSFIEDLKRGEVVTIADSLTDERALAGALLDLGIRVLINVPILVRGRLTALVFAHFDRPHAITDKEILFMRTVADRTQAAVARVEAEDERRILTHELSHRLKNTLTLVQSIASQTLRNAPDVETARDALSLRLIALGQAHDILLAGRRDAADLGDVVRGSLGLHADGPERFRLDGPSLPIGPGAALSLALILHELATNAVKYGALRAENGRVAVDWTVEGTVLRLSWRESGGPAVVPPTRKGFGTRLIERGLAGGEVRTTFDAGGLSCVLTTALSEIGASA
ncbi:sensor histidine kinase [Methylobacterium sp. J-067]|uniref:sensor histidine kinase n=1 Tax=Methylobacterium sp. J-067 TaxID=2836648 RepID=UPI001FBB26D9|nr:HWE histidine kinase domain-containing protein [Methylobacterium sp. J-067]MCJ2024197.1 PAS domain-containing protein [Methylobacterium sp. J-067]